MSLTQTFWLTANKANLVILHYIKCVYVFTVFQDNIATCRSPIEIKWLWKYAAILVIQEKVETRIYLRIL